MNCSRRKKNMLGSQFDPTYVALFVKVQETILAAKENPDEYYAKYSRISKFFSKQAANV
jgi:hypothetical protein